MRTLNYRAWDAKKNLMLYPRTLTTEDVATFFYEKKDKIIMPATGLLDSAKKEIFEGDIIRSPRHWNTADGWSENEYRYYFIKWFEAQPFYHGFCAVEFLLSPDDILLENSLGGDRVSTLPIKTSAKHRIIGNIFESRNLIDKADNIAAAEIYAMRGEKFIPNIIDAYCHRFDIDKDALLQHNKNPERIETLELLWLFMRRYGYTYKRIAHETGRTHGTVYSGIQTIENLIDAYPEVKQRFQFITKSLNSL